MYTAPRTTGQPRNLHVLRDAGDGGDRAAEDNEVCIANISPARHTRAYNSARGWPSATLPCRDDLKNAELELPGLQAGYVSREGPTMIDEPCAFRTLRHQSNFLSAPESSARRILALP